MEQYQISQSKRLAKDYAFSENQVDTMRINHYPWDTNGYKPQAECKVVSCTDGFKVRMEAFEKEITATYTQMNDPVYKDSCLEIFVAPFEKHPDYYFNFEMNSLGALLLGYGRNRHDRKRIILENFKDYFQIRAEVHREDLQIKSWSVEFVIPRKLLNEYKPDEDGQIGQQLKGNFYKCGDATQYPHYGCWNLIDMTSPDFHLPQYFGGLWIV